MNQNIPGVDYLFFALLFCAVVALFTLSLARTELWFQLPLACNRCFWIYLENISGVLLLFLFQSSVLTPRYWPVNDHVL